MAFRRDIIEAIFNDISSAISGDYTVVGDDGNEQLLTLSDGEIKRYNPGDEEEHPAVFIDFANERPLNINEIGNSPDKIERDIDGNVIYAQWNEYIEMETFVTVRADTRPQKEPVYREARRQVGRYDAGDLHSTDLHNDIQKLEVQETTPSDSTGQESAIWGDQIQVYVEYLRRYIVESGGSKTMEESVDTINNISQINLEVDLNKDFADEGFTYTIN